MKKSNIQIKKLTKKELKEINGAGGPDCLAQCFCLTPDGEGYIGACSIKGGCC